MFVHIGKFIQQVGSWDTNMIKPDSPVVHTNEDDLCKYLAHPFN